MRAQKDSFDPNPNPNLNANPNPKPNAKPEPNPNCTKQDRSDIKARILMDEDSSAARIQSQLLTKDTRDKINSVLNKDVERPDLRGTGV